MHHVCVHQQQMNFCILRKAQGLKAAQAPATFPKQLRFRRLSSRATKKMSFYARYRGKRRFDNVVGGAFPETPVKYSKASWVCTCCLQSGKSARQAGTDIVAVCEEDHILCEACTRGGLNDLKMSCPILQCGKPVFAGGSASGRLRAKKARDVAYIAMLSAGRAAQTAHNDSLACKSKWARNYDDTLIDVADRALKVAEEASKATSAAASKAHSALCDARRAFRERIQVPQMIKTLKSMDTVVDIEDCGRRRLQIITSGLLCHLDEADRHEVEAHGLKFPDCRYLTAREASNAQRKKAREEALGRVRVLVSYNDLERATDYLIRCEAICAIVAGLVAEVVDELKPTPESATIADFGLEERERAALAVRIAECRAIAALPRIDEATRRTTTVSHVNQINASDVAYFFGLWKSGHLLGQPYVIGQRLRSKEIFEIYTSRYLPRAGRVMPSDNHLVENTYTSIDVAQRNFHVGVNSSYKVRFARGHVASSTSRL